MTKTRKAAALISGGLDSLLAAKVILDQGIHVEGLNFFTGFCVEGHTHAIRKKDKAKPKRNNALWVAEQLGISSAGVGTRLFRARRRLRELVGERQG